jgi:hypothetical protein
MCLGGVLVPRPLPHPTPAGARGGFPGGSGSSAAVMSAVAAMRYSG